MGVFLYLNTDQKIWRGFFRTWLSLIPDITMGREIRWNFFTRHYDK